MIRTCWVGGPPKPLQTPATKRKQPILAVKEVLKRPMTTAEVAKVTGYEISWIRKALRSMLASGCAVQRANTDPRKPLWELT